MTQREAFEAWAKSQNLDPDHKEKDAWDRDVYSPHIHSMWCGWQAAQAQAAVEPQDRLADAGETMEPVCWGIPRDDNNVWYVICNEEHARHEGMYTMPLYTAPPDHAKAMRLALEKLNTLKLAHSVGAPEFGGEDYDEFLNDAIAALGGALTGHKKPCGNYACPECYTQGWRQGND
jgi:hypothetical protein